MRTTRPYRTLVIDDDPDVHGVFGCMLAAASQFTPRVRPGVAGDPKIASEQPAFPTFEIDYAFNGQAGLDCVRKALAENRPYTMAFVDMRMPPGWDGIETINHIWKECFDLQVVICTGHADFSWHDLIHRFGHSDRLLILRKPFDMTELRQAAYSLAEKWDLAHQAQSHLERLQKIVGERTAKLQEANVSLQRKIVENIQAERRLVTQYAVSRAMAECPSLSDAIARVFQIVCESLNWDWGGMWTVDPTANVLRFTHCGHVLASELTAFENFSRTIALAPDSGLPGRVWSTGQPIWMTDIFQDTKCSRAASASQNGLHAAIAFPIWVGIRIVGVMEFFSRDLHEPDKDVLQTFAVIRSAIGQFIERIQAEENLKRERDYVDQIIKETPALVVGIATDGATTFANPAISRSTGYSSAELIGQNWWRLAYPDEEYTQVEQLFKDFEKGPVRDYEMVLTTKTGEKRTVSWTSLNKYDENHKLIEIIGFGNDITKGKRAEMERRHMETQLRHAQKMESVGHLAAGIAHEINTPTQYLSDNIRFLESSFGDFKKLHAHYQALLQASKDHTVTPELIARTEDAVQQTDVAFLIDEIPKAIEQSLEGVNRVTKIIRAMKDFSHPGTSEKTPIDLNRAIQTTLAVAANEWKYVATVKTEFDEQLPPVPCLPGELNQVLLNLIVNSAHAITDVVSSNPKQKGVITISTCLSGDWVELRIRDTGTGIPAKIRDKIFNPFFTTKPVGKGTGQGLAISHAVIVDQHGGTLAFETEIGVGTVFIVRLPLDPASRAIPAGVS